MKFKRNRKSQQSSKLSSCIDKGLKCSESSGLYVEGSTISQNKISLCNETSNVCEEKINIGMNHDGQHKLFRPYVGNK